MKNLFHILIILVFCLPVSLSAQSIIGNWKAEVPGPDGNTVVFEVSMKADGTYTVDFGADGSAEINGKYEIDGKQMTIQDTGGEQACTGGKGVYNVENSGDKLTMTRVSDSCEGRGGPNGVMIFTKA